MGVGYKNQWINTFHKDLSSYDQFKEAVTEFYGYHKLRLDGDVVYIKAFIIETRAGL
jgi:hypothetical protein